MVLDYHHYDDYCAEEYRCYEECAECAAVVSEASRSLLLWTGKITARNIAEYSNFLRRSIDRGGRFIDFHYNRLFQTRPTSPCHINTLYQLVREWYEDKKAAEISQLDNIDSTLETAGFAQSMAALETAGFALHQAREYVDRLQDYIIGRINDIILLAIKYDMADLFEYITESSDIDLSTDEFALVYYMNEAIANNAIMIFTLVYKKLERLDYFAESNFSYNSNYRELCKKIEETRGLSNKFLLFMKKELDNLPPHCATIYRQAFASVYLR